MAAPKLQRPRGTQDRFGDDAARFERVIDTFRRVYRLYGFRPVDVPVFEATGVFARTLGETTDVVAKEMYSFDDRSGDSLTLRPEFTAGICRAYIENGWQQHAPLKLAAWGPLFRYERPQKGRFRQFHQVDAEVIGASEPAADVEVIALGAQLLDELGIGDKVVLQLNTLGDAETRGAWRAALVAHFGAHREVLSAESLRRLEVNPLRILDSKDPGDRALVADAPGIDAFMTSEAGRFFEAVQQGLEAAGVAHVRAPTLVRGFDYYRHTAFEFVTEALGAQGTVLAGGRYDGLIETLGGPATPAVGWAAGVERLAMLVSQPATDTIDLAVIADTPELEDEVLIVSAALRRGGISVANAYKGSAKRRTELAARDSVSSILFVRDAPSPSLRLHLSDRLRDGKGRERLQRVLASLPSTYGGLSGDRVDEADGAA